jgi:hypothetical protein
MKMDALKQYQTIREGLLNEKRELETRLSALTQALGQNSRPTRSISDVSSTGPRTSSSLKSLVFEVLAHGALSKEDLLAKIQERGYKFQTRDPLNSLGTILYGKNPRFTREGDRFGLPANRAPSPKKSGKRTMSPEAKARIAAAQRKRWAAVKRAQGSKNRLK